MTPEHRWFLNPIPRTSGALYLRRYPLGYEVSETRTEKSIAGAADRQAAQAMADAMTRYINETVILNAVAEHHQHRRVISRILGKNEL